MKESRLDTDIICFPQGKVWHRANPQGAWTTRCGKKLPHEVKALVVGQKRNLVCSLCEKMYQESHKQVKYYRLVVRPIFSFGTISEVESRMTKEQLNDWPSSAESRLLSTLEDNILDRLAEYRIDALHDYAFPGSDIYLFLRSKLDISELQRKVSGILTGIPHKGYASVSIHDGHLNPVMRTFETVAEYFRERFDKKG